jgi:TM2 domain-containing membrane protein YozV
VTYSWTVGSLPSGVLITSASGATVTAGHGTRFIVRATGTSTPKLAIVGSLPQGVTFADNGDGTATLGGVPVAAAAGTYTLTILAWDDTSSTVQTFELTVLPEPGVVPAEGTTAPVVTSTNVAPNVVTGPSATTKGVLPDATSGQSATVTQMKPAVQPSVEPTRYWLAGRDGRVFTFGASKGSDRSTDAMQLHEPVVGMAAISGAHGYWLVASDGGVFSYGDARFYGSTGGKALKRPIVGMAVSDAKGYWLVASDGGVFSFGDARFYGSTGGKALKHEIVAMAATPSGHGYWLVASDGEIFGFNAPLFGSTGGTALKQPIVGMATGA